LSELVSLVFVLKQMSRLDRASGERVRPSTSTGDPDVKPGEAVAAGLPSWYDGVGSAT
jgi:hypothetical protein